tara:strand:+ start:3597 stop:4145 length:549 start_codon:yes stop_codon:yes gene_type:complete
MNISKLDPFDIAEITPLPRGDDRGYFMRTFDEDIFASNGLPTDWVQENQAYTKKAGTLRGMHFQQGKYAETKFIRVVRGAILDVFIDLRQNSKTYEKWGKRILSADNKAMLVIPQGFAHGYLTLEEDTWVIYRVDNAYNGDSELGIQWNDPSLNIDWGISDPILSEKDKNLPTLKNLRYRFS